METFSESKVHLKQNDGVLSEEEVSRIKAEIEREEKNLQEKKE